MTSKSKSLTKLMIAGIVCGLIIGFISILVIKYMKFFNRKREII